MCLYLHLCVLMCICTCTHVCMYFYSFVCVFVIKCLLLLAGFETFFPLRGLDEMVEMGVCMYTFVCIFTQFCVCLCTFVCLYVYFRVYVYLCLCMPVYICVYVCMCIQKPNTCMDCEFTESLQWMFHRGLHNRQSLLIARTTFIPEFFKSENVYQLN